MEGGEVYGGEILEVYFGYVKYDRRGYSRRCGFGGVF